MTGIKNDEDQNRLTLNSLLSPVQKQGDAKNPTFPDDGKQANYIVKDENLVTELVAEEDTNSIDKSEILTSTDEGNWSNESSNSFETFGNYVPNFKETIISCESSDISSYIQYPARWGIVSSVLLVILSNFAHRMSFAAVR